MKAPKSQRRDMKRKSLKYWVRLQDRRAFNNLLYPPSWATIAKFTENIIENIMKELAIIP